MTDKKAKLPSGFIDLGESEKEKYGGMGAMPMPIEETPERIHYPCLYFSGKDDLSNLPDEGTAIIHYKKKMERKENIKEDGKEKTRYSVELEIHGIKAGESDAEEASETSDEDAIETGLNAASKAKN